LIHLEITGRLLKLFKLLRAICLFVDFDHIKTHRLAEWSALSNSDEITDINTESRRAVRIQVLVTTLISVVFRDVMQIISSEDDGAGHFGADDRAAQDPSSDAHITRKWAFMVDVRALDCLYRCFVAQPNCFVPSLLSLWLLRVQKQVLFWVS
jgi:hypothetical protein